MSKDEASFYLEQAEKALNPGWLSFTASAPDIAAQFYTKAAEEYAQLRQYREALDLYEKAAQCADAAKAWQTASASRKAAAFLASRQDVRNGNLTVYDCTGTFLSACQSLLKSGQEEQAFEILKRGAEHLERVSAREDDDARGSAMVLYFEMVRIARQLGPSTYLAHALLSVSEASLRAKKKSDAQSACRQVLQVPGCPEQPFRQAALALVVFALLDGDLVEARKRYKMISDLSGLPLQEAASAPDKGPSRAALDELGIRQEAGPESWQIDDIPVRSSGGSFLFSDVGRRLNMLLEAYQDGDQDQFNASLAKLHGEFTTETRKYIKELKCPSYTTTKVDSDGSQLPAYHETGDVEEEDDGLR